MLVKAYAKINLYLDVTAKRNDGYHDIVSIMQTVDLCDTVCVECDREAPGEIRLICDGDLPCDGRNLACRAVQAYFKHEIPCLISVTVQKNIPQQAGLAGGSTDCAAVLRALNAEFDRYSEQELISLGASLGADVPFCLVGGTRITQGIGELLAPCPPMPDCYMVIARGGEGVPTPLAYCALDAMYGDFSAQASVSQQRLHNVIKAIQSQDASALCRSMYNVFESVILPMHSVAPLLRSFMIENGALGAMMSGSGPSIVGIFTDAEKAGQVQKAISDKGIPAFVCKPIN